jgi:hypothetical protein
MRIIITALATAALAFGVGAAQAQSNSAEANVKADTSMKAGSSMSAPKRKHTARHHRAPRYTTGIGSENNASAPGSVLPGKDRLQTKGFIEDH